RESNALEWYRDQHDESVARPPALRVPERVDFIGRIVALVDDAVLLDAGRIAREHVCVSPIVKRVEVNAHLIVAADAFAWRQMTPNLSRLIFAGEHHVQVLTVVGEVRDRALADGTAVGRFTLTEAGHACSFRDPRGGRELVHVGPPRDPWNSDGRQTRR